VQLTKGSETYEWDGNDGAGKPVAQGIYFIKVKALPDSKMQRILKIN
jgi:flagellar hook assembly protein FlgD